MPDIVSGAIEKYALEHTKSPGQLFEELVKATREMTGSAGMMSGPTVGWLLNMLVFATGTKRVLEIGTFTGYSALMMASALPEDGRLVTCDVDPEATGIAKSFWARSPHGYKIELKLGPALDTLKALKGPFGLIFIDADKENYPGYYRRAVDLLDERGVIVVDNVLWGGGVLHPKTASDRVIAELADIVQADVRVENVLLTVRDGLMVVRKKG
ncbi:MAG: methyltransferase [Dehalococcoidia bacterium]|nr:methyltransferase [Dehalococcoidia bacterium]MSQ34307.1 methyltransferase [Dehalococcoidia bacterium]